MIVGIYGIGSQSGHAFLADYLDKGYNVVGYNRDSTNGRMVVEAVRKAGGIHLERPDNSNNELSHFVPLKESIVTNDIATLVDKSDIIIIALPSIFHEEAAQALFEAGVSDKQIPLVLSPSRTLAAPYLWRILGDRYPLACFSTCPYSCKSPAHDVALIKRRKRTWVASLEGSFELKDIDALKHLFPQAALTRLPALTSLNNIGAVFHCATYVMNYEEIQRRRVSNELFSFYIDGIAKRPDVGSVLERIDQMRLAIADRLGVKTFGLEGNPREDVWRKLTNGLRALEDESNDDIEELRNIRGLFMEYLNNSVLSAWHWLDITYGVIRKEGEPLYDTIGRTPTYQKNSVPQWRYVIEDIPTGLVPLEALAKILGVPCAEATEIIDKGNAITGTDLRAKGRNLLDFSPSSIIDYLKGK